MSAGLTEDLGAALRAALLADESVRTAVNGQIVPGALDDEPSPALVYRIVEMTVDAETHGQALSALVNFDLICVAGSMAEAENLVGLVENALNGYHGAPLARPPEIFVKLAGRVDTTEKISKTGERGEFERYAALRVTVRRL